MGRACRQMKTVLLTGLLMIATGFAWAGPLENGYEAHGGLAKWKSFGAVEYDFAWNNEKRQRADHQIFDLATRAGLITSDEYAVGGTFAGVWVKPDAKAVGMPPRFYLWTPFYFFGMPFVFADPGVKAESLGQRVLGGKSYDVVRITFTKEAGDSPEDYYLAHFDATTHQLHLAAYIVTYPELSGGKPAPEQEPHAILFEEWQEADGLRVPRRATLYNWKDDNLSGEPRGTLEFTNVKLSTAAPDPQKFARPEGAVEAPLK